MTLFTYLRLLRREFGLKRTLINLRQTDQDLAQVNKPDAEAVRANIQALLEMLTGTAVELRRFIDAESASLKAVTTARKVLHPEIFEEQVNKLSTSIKRRFRSDQPEQAAQP